MIFSHIMIQKYDDVQTVEVIKMHFITVVFRPVCEWFIKPCSVTPSHTLRDDGEHFTVCMTEDQEGSVHKSKEWTLEFSLNVAIVKVLGQNGIF